MTHPFSYDYGLYGWQGGNQGYQYGYTSNPALADMLRSSYETAWTPFHSTPGARGGGYGSYYSLPYFGGGGDYGYDWLYGGWTGTSHEGEWSHGGYYDPYTISPNQAFYNDFIMPVLNRSIAEYQAGMNLVQPGSYRPAIDSPEVESRGAFDTPPAGTYDSPDVTGSGSFGGGEPYAHPFYDSPEVYSSGGFGNPEEPQWSGGGDQPGGGGGGGSSGFG